MKHIMIRNQKIETKFTEFKLKKLLKGTKFKSDEDLIDYLLNEAVKNG